MNSRYDQEVLHVGKPNVGDLKVFYQLVEGMFARKWFSNNGPLSQELEHTLCNYLGVRHCILTANATLGLQVALKALDLTGEVILPAYTFVATAHAVKWEQLTPVFVDVEPTCHTIDTNEIINRITSRTSAIVGVHTWGNPCNVDKIEEIADQHNLAVIYDAAHAFGCDKGGVKIGNFGDCEVFSFHATKFFNTFEGGAITTNDDTLAKRIRLSTNFGFEGVDVVTQLGTNAKMSEIAAAMGLANFKALENLISTNYSNFQVYQQRLKQLPYIALHDPENMNSTNRQYVVAEVQPTSPITRDKLIDRLLDKKVKARRYFFPGCHRMPPYTDDTPKAHNHALPVTDKLCNSVLCLPTGTSISHSDIHRICDIIESSMEEQ